MIMRRPLTNDAHCWDDVTNIQYRQEAQLSQRDRAMLFVTEYFAMSLEITQGHSK